VRETDVVVIGSGFGGSVAALRFAEAGQRVTVLERGDRVSREKFQADLDALWKPHRNSYGIYDVQRRGKHVMPIVGAAVGGGSHVYSAVLFRRHQFGDFPTAIRADDMAPHYTVAEDMLGATPYPDHAPYGDVPSYRRMRDAAATLAAAEPELVEAHGPTRVGVSFAPVDPENGVPGGEFTNRHGCGQRYLDPREAAMLGGDIDTKNTLDRNYLYRAERRGAVIEPLCEADKLEPLSDGRWRVTFRRHLRTRGWSAFAQRWLTLRPEARMSAEETIVAKRVVVAAGAVGSTQLLLRNRDIHKTIEMGPSLGARYTTNGDYLTLVSFRSLAVVWLALLAATLFVALGWWIPAGIAGLAYYASLLAVPIIEPDLGAPISTYVSLRGPAGEPQHVLLQNGTYPQPARMVAAVAISAVTGRFRPRLYRRLRSATRVLAFAIPPFGAIVRSYPLPLLAMGRDRASGTLALDDKGHVRIDYPIEDNRDYYAYIDGAGKKLARAGKMFLLRNPTFTLCKLQQVPHNQGGVPMADDPRDGVVDHAGRAFGLPNLIVLDGSIIPGSIGPNPALTITALAERAMNVILDQIGETDAPVVADVPPAQEVSVA
jgi:cholesterol oxidase